MYLYIKLILRESQWGAQVLVVFLRIIVYNGTITGTGIPSEREGGRMRFRKKLNLFKGVKLNVSKSGVSLTVGRKGVSANVGPEGLFLNTSIPGTGLYDRKKLLDFGGRKNDAAPARGRADTAPDAKLTQAEALTEVFVNIGALARDLPRDWSEEELALPPEDEIVEAAVGEWLSALSLPIDFNVSYEYEGGVLFVDMDLPEIEHLPTVKARQLASGQVKQADKSRKELKAEYARCVFGLGMFCASYFFCVTPHMEKILLSAYTQRRDSRGDLEDVYIYSVVFEREGFEQPGYQHTEPEAFLCRFKNRMNKAADGTLKRIEPFGPDAVGM